MNKYGVSEAKSRVGFRTYAVSSPVARTGKSFRDLLVKSAVFVSAFSLVFSVFTPVGASNDKIKICHATDSNSNPYVKNEPDKNGTVGGHSGHNGPIWFSGITQSWGDIIPSFNYWQNGWQTYPGKNWNSQGEAIWNADCKAGTLTLVKVVEGSNAPVSDWTLSAEGTYDFSGVSGTAAVTNVLVPAKQYTLSESGPGGYDASSWVCKDKGNNQPVTVTNGNKVNIPDKKDISCTITNTKQQPRVGELTLVKIVSGGNAQASAWTLYADGETDISGTTGSDDVTDAEVLPGTYILGEEGGPEGYTGIWSCEETSDKSTVVIDDNQIVIKAGDDIICTVTNTYTPDPDVPLLHFVKVVCDEYGDVYGNKDADKEDDTGGKYSLFKNSPAFGGIVKPVSPDEIPKDAGCERADGWKFKLATDLPQTQQVSEVGPTTGGEFVTPISGEGSALTLEQQNAIRNGQLWISEVEQEGYGFAAIRCFNDALNGDNLEYITLGNDNPKDIYCIAYNVQTKPEEPPCQEGPTWAATVVGSEQGKRKDGSSVIPERSDPNKALGAKDWVPGTGSNFYSLGFGGTITVAFSGYVIDVQGDDLSFHEGTNGSYPDERLSIEVSQNGSDWYPLTDQATNTDLNHVSYADFNETGLAWIKYVRLTDISNSALFPNDADGYDLDAVDATQQLCEPPVPETDCDDIILDVRSLTAVVDDQDRGSCSITGHKYRDNNHNGEIDIEDDLLQGWEIYLNDGEGCSYNELSPEPTVVTDENGFYAFHNLPKGTYYVCERQQNGWDQILPDPSENKYNTVVLSDTSVNDVDFLNDMSNDPCEEEQDNGYDFSSFEEGVKSAIAIINQYQYTVSGCKYYGETDERLEGWLIYVDLNKNREYDNGEPYDYTDNHGYYKIYFGSGDYSLPFHIREELQDGWEQVYPAKPYYHEVYLGGEDQSATGLDFRNVELPDPCKEPVTFSLISGSETETAGSTNVNPSGNPLLASSYEAGFGPAVTATTVIPPWVDPTTGSFSGSGAVWVSTSTDHPGAGDEGSSTEDQWRLFKHDFNIPDADSIEQATLYFTADNAVTVYLNGVEIASTPVSTFGPNAFPVDANFDDTYSVNFTPIEGDNTLAFVVRNSGGEYGPSNPTALLYATSVIYTPACDDGGDDDGGGNNDGGGRSGGSSTTGRVLGDETSIPYQAPQVLGDSTELPRTGTPISIAFSIFGILAIIMIPRYAKVAVK